MPNSTYTGDPANVPIDALRLVLPDKCEPYKFTDAELQFFLDEAAGDTLVAAICAADSLVGHYANCVSKSIGKVKIEYQQQHEMWINRLKQLRIKKYGSEDAKDCPKIKFTYTAPTSSCDCCEGSTCVKKPVFSVGMFDGECCD